MTNVTITIEPCTVAYCGYDTCGCTLVRVMNPLVSAVTGFNFCVVRFTRERRGWPRHAAVFHDSSVASYVEAGEACVLEDGLSLGDAQISAARRNAEEMNEESQKNKG